MPTYTDNFFGLELDFPLGWHVRTWKEKAKKSSTTHQFLKNEQDFPIEHDEFKLLFTAILRLEGSHNIVDATLNLSLIKRRADYSLKEEPNTNHKGTKTQLSLLKKFGQQMQSLSIEFDSGEPTAIFKHYAWPYLKGYWFIATLTCLNESGRIHAEDTFDLLHKKE